MIYAIGFIDGTEKVFEQEPATWALRTDEGIAWFDFTDAAGGIIVTVQASQVKYVWEGEDESG